MESANPTNEQQPKERRFKVGDIVCWTNDNGVKWHARRIIGFDDPDKWGHRYYLEPTDAPWMYTREKNLALETLGGDALERTLSHDYSLRKFCGRHPHYLGDVAAFIAKRRQLHLSETHGKMPQCNLVVDGTDDGGNFAGDGEKYPFVVFDIDAQENIAGPFKTRADGETAREEILAGATPVLDSAALLAILEAMDEGIPPEVTFQAGQQVMFTSTNSDAKRNGKVNVKVEIVRPLTDLEADLDEVGKMYKIRFTDGHIEDAFVDELSAGKLPAPTKYRDGTAGNVIALEVDQLTLLGVARIESVGSENIYIAKDSLHYYCKVMATENYVVGEWDFVAQRKLPEVEHEYLFDVHLDASITIKATSEEVASGALRAELQCASANLGEILGQTIVCEVSLNSVPVLAMIDCEDPPHRKMPEIDREALAEAEFIGYDFGEGVQVLDHNRWDTNDEADITKIAYLEYDDDAPDADSHKATFHVRFRPDGSIDDVYALEVKSGNRIGQRKLPETPLVKFLELLSSADEVCVDDSPRGTAWATSSLTGEAENEVARFWWTGDDMQDYTVILTEGGISGGKWVGTSFFCEDHEGDETQITLLKSLPIVP